MAAFKDILQFVKSDKRGLIVQVIGVTDTGLNVFHRDYSGTTRTFVVPDNDEFVVVGVAKIGPRMDATPAVAAPALPPPLDPEELLKEPLPPEAKIVPIEPEPEPEPPKKKRGRPMGRKPGWKPPEPVSQQ